MKCNKEGIVCIVFAMICIGFEYFIFNSCNNLIFILGLCFATLIIIYGVKNLKSSLESKLNKSINEKATILESNISNDIKYIFSSRQSRVIGVIYAIVIMVSYYLMGRNIHELSVNILISVYICYINYFTGCTIWCLYKYLVGIENWVKEIKFDIFYGEQYEIRLLRELQNKILWLGIVYSVISQASTLFSDLKVNIIICVYIIFSITLVLASKIRFERCIYKFANQAFYEKNDNFNSQINTIYSSLSSDNDISSRDRCSIDTLNELIELKRVLFEGFSRQKTTARVLSVVSMIFTIFLPVLLQFFLEQI